MRQDGITHAQDGITHACWGEFRNHNFVTYPRCQAILHAAGFESWQPSQDSSSFTVFGRTTAFK